MEILLTGASGFVGQRVLPQLLADGHTVYSLGRRATQSAQGNLVEVFGNLMDDRWAAEVPWERIDAVVHMAAAGVKAARRNWREAFEVNIGGTMYLLSAIKQHATKRPRLLVTRSFYERVMDQEPELSRNAYIATKAVSTAMIKAWSQDYEGQVCFATLFQIYGPGDDRGSVLTYAAHQLATGQSAKLGSGLGLRDWLYIDDAARAIVAMLKADTRGTTEWDIGSGQLVSLREMLEKLVKVARGNGALLEFDPARDRGDIALRLAAECQLPGWQPATSATEGLEKIWAAAKLEANR